MQGAIEINQERCKGCRLCAVACPLGLLDLAKRKVNRKGYPYVEQHDKEKCTGCTACAIVCPDGCISVYREGGLRRAKVPQQTTPEVFQTAYTESEKGNQLPHPEEAQSSQEVHLMKGNEAIAHAAIRCGCDGYFGYPITPQSEILETLTQLKPWETTGMVVLQAESEVAAINMLYGGGGSGKRVMTSSSSPGIALMQEGISYMTITEIPTLIINVQRGGPGLGTIQPSQSDYRQATVGGGNGDYRVIVLAPWSVQEMADFVDLGFELAFKYRNPVMMLSDGVIGQMMEKVILPTPKPRRTEEQIAKECPWATNGHGLKGRKPNILTSLEMIPLEMERRNLEMQKKYAQVERDEVRYESYQTEDAEYLIMAFGSIARISMEVVGILRSKGIRIGLLRPITLWPFPEKEVARLGKQVKGIIVAEMNAGQMIDDVRKAVCGSTKVIHFGRLGGVVPEPNEIISQFEQDFL